MYNGSFLSIFFAIILHTAGGQSVYSGIRVLIVGLIDLTNSNSGSFSGCIKQTWQEYAHRDQNPLCGPITKFSIFSIDLHVLIAPHTTFPRYSMRDSGILRVGKFRRFHGPLKSLRTNDLQCRLHAHAAHHKAVRPETSFHVSVPSTCMTMSSHLSPFTQWLDHTLGIPQFLRSSVRQHPQSI